MTLIIETVSIKYNQGTHPRDSKILAFGHISCIVFSCKLNHKNYFSHIINFSNICFWAWMLYLLSLGLIHLFTFLVIDLRQIFFSKQIFSQFLQYHVWLSKLDAFRTWSGKGTRNIKRMCFRFSRRLKGPKNMFSFKFSLRSVFSF